MWLCNRLVLPLWGVQGVQDGSWERVLLHLRRKTGTGCVYCRLQNATERLIDTCVFVRALGHRLFASHPPPFMKVLMLLKYGLEETFGECTGSS